MFYYLPRIFTPFALKRVILLCKRVVHVIISAHGTELCVFYALRSAMRTLVLLLHLSAAIGTESPFNNLAALGAFCLFSACNGFFFRLFGGCRRGGLFLFFALFLFFRSFIFLPESLFLRRNFFVFQPLYAGFFRAVTAEGTEQPFKHPAALGANRLTFSARLFLCRLLVLFYFEFGHFNAVCGGLCTLGTKITVKIRIAIGTLVSHNTPSFILRISSVLLKYIYT